MKLPWEGLAVLVWKVLEGSTPGLVLPDSACMYVCVLCPNSLWVAEHLHLLFTVSLPGLSTHFTQQDLHVSFLMH